EIKKQGFSVVVEGEFDAITPYIKGIKNIVALKGTAFTPQQAKLLKRYAPKAIIFFDNDTAGNQAALRGIEIAQKENLEVQIALLKDVKDPDEAAKKSIDILHKAIEEAMPVYDYYFKFILEKESLEDAFGKKRIVEFLMPKILRIPDAIVKSHYIKKLSELVDIDENALINKSYVLKHSWNDTKETQDTKTKEKEDAQKVLLTYLIWSDKTVFEEFYKKAKKIYKGTDYEKVLEEKKKAGNNKKKLLEKTKHKEILENIFLQDMEAFELNKEGQKAVVSRIINKIEKTQVRNQLNYVILQIKEAEKKGDSKKLVKMQKKFKILTKRLSKLNQSP
ncbi:MAG TPA: toprim domain-containing protein, partial [candidate division WWE3 bacterium]|nr:toprim domain-containing protein [candidate division WWE3 bacterium]